MQVVAIETLGNRGNAPYGGFYGNEDLNQKRRKYGEKFVIKDIKTSAEERIKREEKLGRREYLVVQGEKEFRRKRASVTFSNKADEELYLTYKDFGEWMTGNTGYVPEKATRPEPGKVRKADEQDDLGDVPEVEGLPEGGTEVDPAEVPTRGKRKK